MLFVSNQSLKGKSMTVTIYCKVKFKCLVRKISVFSKDNGFLEFLKYFQLVTMCNHTSLKVLWNCRQIVWYKQYGLWDNFQSSKGSLRRISINKLVTCISQKNLQFMRTMELNVVLSSHTNSVMNFVILYYKNNIQC